MDPTERGESMIPHEVDYDEANCLRCGRKITDARSLERGLSPTCYKKYLKEQSEIGFEEDQITMDEVV